MKNVFLFFVSVVIGIVIVVFLKSFLHKNIVTSKKLTSTFSLEKAPSKSLRGSIASMSGMVRWQSRTATTAALLISPRLLQQQESIETEDDGTISVEFKNRCTMRASPKTKLELVQTLPSHIVIRQDAGSVNYNCGKKSSLAVLSLHALIELSEAANVAILRDESVLTIDVYHGSVQIAFNDLENVSTVIQVDEGSRYIYNDKERNGALESI